MKWNAKINGHAEERPRGRSSKESKSLSLAFERMMQDADENLRKVQKAAAKLSVSGVELRARVKTR